MGAPPPETLRLMGWQSILAALETGRMSSIGAGLTAAERESVAKYLGTGHVRPISIATCTGRPRSNGQWNGWADAANTRFTKASGLNAQTTPKLKLKWAFGFP